MTIEKLTKLFAQHGLHHDAISVITGDTVVRYRVQIDPMRFKGMDKFLALDENIAYLLGLTSKPIIAADYRDGSVIIDTVTGRRSYVSLTDLLPDINWYQRMTKRAGKAGGTLPIIIGRDVDRKPLMIDLAESPHLLVAGTTGSGKSIGLRSMITSLMYMRPNTRFLFIDPKGVELTIFDDIRHENKFAFDLARPYVLTQPEEILEGLEAVADYVEVVFDVLREQKVASMSDVKRPRYVVVVIDELADIITGNKKVMNLLLKIVQKSRAAGVHVIAATQRPSVDIVSGTVKANFPGRLAFKVSSRQDSTTILGNMGAERLLGKGDFLYRISPGIFKRGQGAYVSDAQIQEALKSRKLYIG